MASTTTPDPEKISQEFVIYTVHGSGGHDSPEKVMEKINTKLSEGWKVYKQSQSSAQGRELISITFEKLPIKK